MKKVTLWYKIIRNEDGEITSSPFNHLDDGWKEEWKPLPKSDLYTNQSAWSHEEWLKQWKLITGDYIVKEVENK